MPINFDNENNFLDLYLNEIEEKNSNLNLDDKNHMISNIRDISEKIYNEIKNNKEKRISILLAGYVQSGKTNSFLGCIAKLMEEYSNFSVIFLGVQKELYNQNLERLNIFRNSVGLSNIFLIYDNKYNFDDSLKQQIECEFKKGKKIIFCILKNYKSINKISNFLCNLKFIKNPIIIDDEGDQFSFTNIKKIKSNSDSNHYTATYKSIYNMLNIFDIYSFITVTATPYAHILVNQKYGKNKNYIKPQYGHVIKKGNNYLGLDFFLGGLDGIDTVRIIKDQQEIDELTKFNIPTSSLKESLCYFFTYGLIYYYDLTKKKRSPEMLIHFNVKANNNNELEENIKKYLKKFSKNITDTNSDEQKWIECAVNEYNNFIINNFNDDSKTVNFSDVVKKLHELVNEDNVLVNAIIGKKSKENDNSKIFKIFLGSKKIDRGNTFGDLIISFVTKRSKKEAQADTLLQMCRWFGYREKYKHLIRIWLSNDLISDYSSIYNLEENVMNILENCEKNSLEIYDLPRYLEIKQWSDSKKLFGTRKTVDEQKYIYELSKSWRYSNFFKNIPIFQETNNILYKYFQRFITIWNENKNFLEKDLFLKKIGNFPCILYNQNEFEKFSNDLGSNLCKKLDFILNDTENSYYFDDYNNIILNSIKEKLKTSKGIIVAYMCKNINNKLEDFSFDDDSTIRTRRFDNERITILEKGPNDNYLGDKYWYKEYKDYVFLQLHRIKPISDVEINTGTKDGCIYKLMLIFDN